MNKVIIAVLMGILLLTIGLSGCSTEVNAYTESSQTVNVKPDSEFMIALGSNPTTGYSWQPVYDSSYLTLSSKEYKADDKTGKQLVGSGGTEYFRFKALKTGEVKITFTYYRPWETPAPQDQTQVFTISVK